MACTVMEKHKANRNTALTKAPTTSALAQPKVLLSHFFLLNLNNSPRYFLEYKTDRKVLPDTNERNNEGDDVTEHVEAVCHESHGVGVVAHYELHQHETAGHAQHAQDLGSRPATGATQDSRKFHPQS